MDSAVESTPHANAVIFNSTHEGAAPIAAFMDDDFIKEQTGEEILLRSTSGYLLPGNPWPKTEEVLDKNTAFAFTQRKKYGYRQEQGNSWDQYGDSSSAASASASAEDSGRGNRSKSELTYSGQLPAQYLCLRLSGCFLASHFAMGRGGGRVVHQSQHYAI